MKRKIITEGVRNIVYKTMFYCVSVYTIRGTDIPYVFSVSTCFGLMGPSSGTLVFTINYFPYAISPPPHWSVWGK
jgi:hypothetical protein